MSTTSSATKTERSASPKQLAGRINPESLVRAALDDIALVIGGAAAIHHIDDDLVWTVMKRLDRIRTLRDLNGVGRSDDIQTNHVKPPRVHAAVEEFLSRNRAGLEE